MASVNPISGPAEERGQLVVITGLVIAVALVGLVLIVNTAIYTENLATRDPDVGDEEAIEYADTVRTGVGGVMDRENEREYDAYGKVRSNATAGVEALDENLGRTYLERAIDAHVNTTSISYAEGTLIRQTDSSRQFRSANDDVDWQLVESTDGTRSFAATVDRSSLDTTTEDDLGDAFNLTVSGDGEEWHAYVYENGDGEIAIAVENESETEPSERCSVATTEATIDFTAGTLDGEPCPDLRWADGVSGQYEIDFRNGDAAAGTYELTVAATEGELLTDLFESDPADGDPYYVPAVYSADVEITYRTPELLFETELRVAPGEPDE